MATAISRTCKALAMDHSSWVTVAALPCRPAAAGRHLVHHHMALPRQTRRRSRGNAERHARAPRHDRRVRPLMLQALGRSAAADTPERVLAWFLRSCDAPSGLRATDLLSDLFSDLISGLMSDLTLDLISVLISDLISDARSD